MADAQLREGPSRAQLIAAFAAVYLIWGSTYLAIRFAIETLPPFLMAGTRFLIAGAVLYGWSRMRGAGRPAAVQWRAAAIVGGLLLLGGNGLVVWSEQWVASGMAALLIATEPLWIVILNWLRPGGERPGPGIMAGMVLGFGGIALLIGPGDWAGEGGMHVIGSIALILAALSWAGGSIYSLGAKLPSSPLLATAMEMLAGGALLLGVGVLAGEPAQVEATAISFRSVAALLYLIVFGSLIAFSAYVWLLGNARPARVATYAYVNPVVAVLLGWALAGEPFTARMALAMAVVVGAVALITIQHAEPEKHSPTERRPVLFTAAPEPDSACPPRSAMAAVPAHRACERHPRERFQPEVGRARERA